MKKILIAEDDRFLANAYKVKLAKSGFETQIASDGDEVMAMLSSFIPDIIVLDLVMPGKDGFSVLTDLKKDPKLSKIPVIVASNLGQKEDADRARALGADDYIIKTDMSLGGIIEKINKVIGTKPHE